MMLNVARRAYSAEQLLALRKSASDEPAHKIETRAEDGAIKDTPSPVERKRAPCPSPLTLNVAQDHVLRNAHSFAARSTRSFAASDTLRPPNSEHRQFGGPVLGEIDTNNQTLRPLTNRFRSSPTPSFEKRKAEQILKDHGSPPGLRVTAGGRIVPSDQSPLCSPRFGYSAIQKNGGLIRFAPNYPPPGGTGSLQDAPQSLPNGFVAQEPNGRLIQVVDGQLLPVNEVNGLPQLYIAAPNLNNFPPPKTGANAIRQQNGQARGSSSANGVRMRQPTLSLSIQIQALEKQYGKLEQESRDLDKLEVLQRTSMTSKAYQLLVQKRRELVTRLNDIRISLKELRDQQRSSSEHVSPQMDERSSPPQRHVQPFAGLPAVPHNHLSAGPYSGWTTDGLAADAHGMMAYPGGLMPTPAELGFYISQPGTFGSHVNPYAQMALGAGPFPPLFNLMGMPPTEAFQSYPNVVNATPQLFPGQAPTAPNTESVREGGQSFRNRSANDTASSEKESPRRSHALEIKNPEIKSESGQVNKSSLNPMSPSYQPASISAKPSTPQTKPTRIQAESPSPALAEAVRAHNAWVGESRASNSTGSQRVYRYESSNASFATADFFPNNPRDHSANKQAYPVAGNRSMTSVKRTVENTMGTPADETPVTPEKEHHNPNWNPTIPDAAFESVVTPPIDRETMIAPPGTPANGDVSYNNDPVTDRSQNNMSPKGRRPGFVPLNAGKPTKELAALNTQPCSGTTDRSKQERAISSLSSRLPTSSSGSAYTEGFKAGETRLPIGPDKSTIWLDGYCAGLRASVNTNTKEAGPEVQENAEQSPLSPAKATQSMCLLQMDDKCTARPPHAPFEMGAASMDTLKEAVFSTQNENVILSPDSSTPAVDDIPSPKLGGWTNQHECLSSTESVLIQLRNGQASFPERTSSMIQRQLVGPDSTDNSMKNDPVETDSTTVPEVRRNFSVQSQPSASTQASYLRAVYPGNRVLSSQLEWKSGSSIAQVAGLAHGYVAQFDGSMIQDAKASSKAKGSAPSPQHPRFVEGCMRIDGGPGSSPSSSPGKKSPTKVKFAHIAGKAGIKVRMDEQTDEDCMSPKEKPRWRDVWRKGH